MEILSTFIAATLAYSLTQFLFGFRKSKYDDKLDEHSKHILDLSCRINDLELMHDEDGIADLHKKIEALRSGPSEFDAEEGIIPSTNSQKQRNSAAEICEKSLARHNPTICTKGNIQ
jgi:hypothetical protein